MYTIKEKLTTLFIGAVAVSIVIGAINIFEYILKKPEISPPSPVVINQPSQYPDFDAIKGPRPDLKITPIKITDSCPSSGCRNDKPATIDFDGISKHYEVRGKFARAYLYIEAFVDYNRPLTVWDDFYFKVNGLGGHLISDSNLLPIPPSDISRFLYDLRSISYFPSIKDKEKNISKKLNIDLFTLIQNGITLDITAAISSNRPGRIMKEVSIYYECFEGSECSIQEKK